MTHSLSPSKTIPFKATKEFDDCVNKVESHVGDYVSLLTNLSNLLGSLSSKRERLELIQTAPDSTFGVLAKHDGMRESLSIGYVSMCRKTLHAIQTLQQQLDTTKSNIELTAITAFQTIAKHRLNDVDAVSTRNDAAPSVVDKIELVENTRIITVSLHAQIQTTLANLSLDSNVEALNSMVSNLDRIESELLSKIKNQSIFLFFVFPFSK